VGVNGLRPEASTNVSAGLVLNPAANLAITLDAYQITIRDRIVGSGSLYGSGGAVNSPAVTAAILANGNVLDPTVVQTGINIFSNAVNTRSRGLEFVTTLNSSYGANGKVDWSLAANYNKVQVIKINQAPAQLQPQTLLDATAISDLETGPSTPAKRSTASPRSCNPRMARPTTKPRSSRPRSRTSNSATSSTRPGPCRWARTTCSTSTRTTSTGNCWPSSAPTWTTPPSASTRRSRRSASMGVTTMRGWG
jgi:outer membrane receptor protein involved in Fe transport